MADAKISALTSVTTPLAGTEALPIVQSSSTKKVTVDNLTKGRTVNASSFDTDVAAAGVTLSGVTLAADGTDANIDINITPKGTGEVNLTKVDIDGGAIDGTTIGVTTPASVKGTSITATTDMMIRTGGILYFNNAADSANGRIYSPGGGSISLAGYDVEMLRINETTNIIAYRNIYFSRAGDGIDFAADPNPGGMTSEVLDDYEEGTWTPIDSSGAGLTLTVANATYTKVGRLVTANFAIVYPTTASASTCRVGGLPFTSRSGAFSYPMVVSTNQTGVCKNGLVDDGATTFLLVDTGGNALTNVQMSTLFLRGTVIYEV
jgi:hypothetical protein